MPRQNLQNKISIGVSSCLLGEFSRYDGGHKKSPIILSSLCSIFTCVSLCPEFDIGLGVPRLPIRLTLDAQQRVRAIMPGNIDVTQGIQRYAANIAAELTKLSGYVLKSKSPSCGVNSTKLFASDQRFIKLSNGIFTTRLRELLPTLPICEETDLLSTADVDKFIAEVIGFNTKNHLRAALDF